MDATWQAIAASLSQALNQDCQYQSHQSVSGGCINQSYIMRCQDGENYFVKLNQAKRQDMFEAELAGLQAMHSSHSIRVPLAYCYGSAGAYSFIVMQALQFGHGGDASMKKFGQALADLHRCVEPDGRYGWHIDNTIGSTPQTNAWRSNWVEFWRDNRLAFQLQLAARNGYGGQLQKAGEQLLSQLDAFFDRQPDASMLHGDLWSGNYDVCTDGEAAIFDPAFYYGDREADLAMTELFGGFPATFYRAYNDAYPLPQEYAVRKVLYNSYHIINHLNLFGSSYLGQAESMLQRLLSELR